MFLVHVNVILNLNTDAHPFEIDTKRRLFAVDVCINWATKRNWQSKVLDTWKVTQLNLPRQENVNFQASCECISGTDLGSYAPQGSASLLPKLSVTSKVSARTSYAWVGSRVHFRSSEDVTLLEFTSPVDREYMHRRRKFH